jgi:hypothetical protein
MHSRAAQCAGSADHEAGQCPASFFMTALKIAQAGLE